MKAVPDEPATWDRLSPGLRESWGRSAASLTDPASAVAPMDFDGADLNSYRRDHVLARVLPVFRRLLVSPAAEAGLVVAIGDARGTLLWVDGDRPMLRRAEARAFQAGANWSESAIGTSAPGIVLATGHGAQVHQEEHYAYAAHPFSCSAVPIHHPHTGELLGVVDLTGGQQAVATHSLPLLFAAVSAAEAELKTLEPPRGSPQLRTLGTLSPHLEVGGDRISLSLRHAEILLLLVWYQRWRGAPGLTAEELAQHLYGEAGHEVALRAEMVRLRRRLRARALAGSVDLLSRPYRLEPELDTDAVQAAQALTAGSRSSALDIYGGQLLLASEAPGVLEVRRELSALLRESLLADGTGQQLWRYLQLPEASDDAAAVYAALRQLPRESPLRAALVARSHTPQPSRR